MIRNLAENIKHVVRDVAAQASDSSYCVKHSCECATNRSRTTDVLIGGTPCQPFTAMRRNQCRKHPLYNVTFGDSDMPDPTNSLMHLIERTLPGALILEQVANFAHFDDSLQEKPADRLVTKLFGVKGADGKAHFKAVRSFEINSSIWVKLERPRFPDPQAESVCECRKQVSCD
jgi:site-specific DNA-cytosine methylase